MRGKENSTILTVCSAADRLSGDPTSPYYSARSIGYNASKAMLNMLTVQLAHELCDTPIVVNSASPGYYPALIGRRNALAAWNN
jgi:NAD(P)-dependent dehydrogenase (short-subunit alcohol dehydrogenase family)